MNTVMKVCSIDTLPNESKPVNRLMVYGPETLTTDELISTILSSKDLNQYNLNELMHLSFSKLRIHGLSKNNAIKISALMELTKRINNEVNNAAPSLTSAEKAARYFSDMKYLEKEQFRIVCLDLRNRIIEDQIITIGTINSSLVSTRETVIEALRAKAVSVIVTHNHPTGNPAPSGCDIEVTQNLKKAFDTVGIKMNDHIIIAGDSFYSFAEHGML